jgi:hypothetical protein
VLWRACREAGDANLFLIAGGVTYAIILALFLGLAAHSASAPLPASCWWYGARRAG